MNNLIQNARRDAAEIKGKLYGTGSPKGLFTRLKEELESPSRSVALEGGAGIIHKKFTNEEKSNAAGRIATMERRAKAALERINSSDEEKTVYTELAWLFSFMGESAGITMEKLAAEPDREAVSYAIKAGFSESQIAQIENFISDFLPWGSRLEVPGSAYDKPAKTGNAKQGILFSHPNFAGSETVGNFTMEFSTKTIGEFVYMDVLKNSQVRQGASPGSVELINRSLDIHVNSGHIAKAGILPIKHLGEALEKAGVRFSELMLDLAWPKLIGHMVALVSPVIGSGTELISYAGASFIIKPGDYDFGNGDAISVFRDMEASLAFHQNTRDLKIEFVIKSVGNEKVKHVQDLGNYIAGNDSQEE